MSAKVMIRHLGRLSGAEANRRHKRVRMLRDLPTVAAAYGTGEVGSCQIDALARTHANPRVAQFMPAAEELLLEDARTHSFREFTTLLGSWERHVDADGATQKAKAAHDGRDVRITRDFDGGWHLEGRFGPTQGSIIKHILGGFTRAETTVDWDKAKAEHGDRATQANLARTAAQRRADGFWELCRRAVTQPADGTTPEPLVNIVIDHQTALEQAAGTRPDPMTDPAGYRTRRCSTLAGDPIEPSDAFAAILTGQLRRAVFDTRSVVTDLGRKSRFFTGSARQAAQLARAICAWTGCEIPSEHCEIDHATQPPLHHHPPRRRHRSGLSTRPGTLAHPPPRRHRTPLGEGWDCCRHWFNGVLAAPSHLEAGKGCGRAHVERVQMAGKRYRHDRVAALTNQSRQTVALCSQDQDDAFGGEVQIEERTRTRCVQPDAPDPGVAQHSQRRGQAAHERDREMFYRSCSGLGCGGRDVDRSVARQHETRGAGTFRRTDDRPQVARIGDAVERDQEWGVIRVPGEVGELDGFERCRSCHNSLRS